jgi:hypothetical protein
MVMPVDWNAILHQAIAAAGQSLAANWATVAPSAEHSIGLLLQTAEYIAANKDTLSAPEQKMLVDNQKLAMQNVLLGYEDVGILAAEQAVAAAWAVINGALMTAIGAATP